MSAELKLLTPAEAASKRHDDNMKSLVAMFNYKTAVGQQLCDIRCVETIPNLPKNTREAFEAMIVAAGWLIVHHATITIEQWDAIRKYDNGAWLDRWTSQILNYVFFRPPPQPTA